MQDRRTVIATRRAPMGEQDGHAAFCTGDAVADIIVVVWKGAAEGESLSPLLTFQRSHQRGRAFRGLLP